MTALECKNQSSKDQSLANHKSRRLLLDVGSAFDHVQRQLQCTVYSQSRHRISATVCSSIRIMHAPRRASASICCQKYRKLALIQSISVVRTVNTCLKLREYLAVVSRHRSTMAACNTTVLRARLVTLSCHAPKARGIFTHVGDAGHVTGDAGHVTASMAACLPLHASNGSGSARRWQRHLPAGCPLSAKPAPAGLPPAEVGRNY